MRLSSIAAFCCAAIAACSSGNNTDLTNSNTLTIDYSGDSYLLGPANDDNPKFLVFLPLASWDNACNTGEHTGLAERWEYSSDRRRWTIYLRQNIRWHDGVPVTARDIEFSINLWRHPDVDWYGASGVDSVQVIDDYTITLFLDEPGTYALLDWDVYYPRHLLDSLPPADFFTWDFWTHPIGNGPYRYVSHDPETHIEFEAYPDYYEGEPAIKHVRITLADVPGLVRFRAGETDWAGANPMDAASLTQDEDVHVYYGGWGSPIRLVWNVTNPLFREKMIRQALTLAMDRRAIVNAVGLPGDTPTSDGTYTSCQFERRELPPAWPYDTAAALRILEAAGWRDTDGDRVLDRDGQPFRFLTIISQGWEPLGILAQNQLARIGVQMELQVLENSVVYERYTAGDFEAAIPRLSQMDQRFGRPDAPNGYENQRVQDLYALISETLDFDARDRITREIADIFYDEIPGTFLVPRLQAAVAREWIRGLDATMTAFPRVERLWIEHQN